MKYLLLGILLLFSVPSFALTVSLNPANGLDYNSKLLESAVYSSLDRKLIIEIESETLEEFKGDSYLDLYDKNYPNGDFYYLIGDLDSDWAGRDYERFYSVASWLSRRGFRTIIVPNAYIPDVQEAVQNPNTSAIIWNSHGASNGEVEDFANNDLPSNIFIENKSKRLKYILFANCYGVASKRFYNLDEISGLFSIGWRGTTTSNALFKYLFSAKFDIGLEKAFGTKLIKKEIRAITNLN